MFSYQQKLIGAGVTGTTVWQGLSTSLSSDGNTLAIGGPRDNSGDFGGSDGATWIFNRSGLTWDQQGEKLIGNGASLQAPVTYHVKKVIKVNN